MSDNPNDNPYGIRLVGDGASDPRSLDFAMFSDEGNRAVARMVVAISEAVREQHLDEEAAGALLRQHVERVRRQGHDEVTDTMVRDTINEALRGLWLEHYGRGPTTAEDWIE